MQKTNKQLDKLLGRLQKIRANLEKTFAVREWKKFLSLSYAEQNKIRKEWDNYYSEVRESPIYALYQAQKNALLQNRLYDVKELANEAKRMREDENSRTVEKPKYTDPFVYDFGATVRAYRETERRIKELLDTAVEDDSKELSSIFGTNEYE